MFVPSGLASHDERVAWQLGMTTTHARMVTVRVMTLDHRQVTRELHAEIIDGQVIIDTSRDAISACSLTLLDPTQSIGWEPNSARDFPHLQRMVQVIDARLVAGVGGQPWSWVECPVFTGPVVDIDRDGATVTISADSKDRLALCNFPRAKTWRAKLRVVDVITDMLVNFAGENPNRIHLPQGLKATTPERISVTREDLVWVQVRRLAESVGFKIFYDGRGHCVMRRASSSAAMTIDRTSLASAVRMDREAPEIKNRWIVLGPKPKAHKKQVTADIALPKRHPWSAQSLGRSNGSSFVPRWLIDIQKPGQVKNHLIALKIAIKQRNEQLRTSQQVTVDHLPFPQIEPYDLVKVIDPRLGVFLIRANQYTLPLGDGGPATLGAVRKASQQPRHKRRRRNGEHKHHGNQGKRWNAA
ncbi:hypothetical protein [Nocardioides montaniterrae]